MTARAETILETVLTALATITVAAGYNYTLSGSEGVHEGEPGTADAQLASVWVWPELDNVEDQLLTVDGFRLVLHLEGRVPTTSSALGTKSRAYIRLYSDLQKALTTAFLPGGTLAELPWLKTMHLKSRGPGAGMAAGLAPGMAIVPLDLIFTYPCPFGTGV